MNTSESNIEIAKAIETLANTFSPFRQSVYSDDEVGTIGCMLEAQISVAKGLFAIAREIREYNEMIREKQ